MANLQRVLRRSLVVSTVVALRSQQQHPFVVRGMAVGVAMLKREGARGMAVRAAAVTMVCGSSLRSTTTTTTTTTLPTSRVSLSSRYGNQQRLFSAASGSSDFQAASPPGTHGTPVFDDIDFGVLEEHDGSTEDIHLESFQRNSDPEAVFVVTGASRGIGLQFVKSLMDRTKGTIVACCRSPSSAHHLTSFANTLQDPERLDIIVALDLERQETIESVGTYLREKYTRVDLLLNVAGLLGDSKTTPGPERSLSQMDRAWLEKSMAINVIGPVMFTKELVPLMLPPRRSTKKDTMEKGRPVPVVVNLSARVGSISDNGLGGWYSYRMSKSALNQYTRTLALELKRRGGGGGGAWAIAVHPGTTNTDLSLPFQANVKEGSLFPVEFTVHKLLNVIDALEEKHSGGFYDWAGQALSF